MRPPVVATAALFCCFVLAGGAVFVWFDCTSYYSKALTDRHLTSFINNMAEKSCPPGMRYYVTGFSRGRSVCRLELDMESHLDDIKTNEECYKSYLKITAYALSEAWGTPWGCTGRYVKTKLTPFYTIKREVKSVRTLADSVSTSAPCDHPLLGANQTFTIKCAMNKYGGYEWRENERLGCFMRGLESIDKEKIDKVLTRLEGPAQCLALQLMIYGRVKYLTLSEKDPHKLIDETHSTLKIWFKQCIEMDPSLNQFFVSGFFGLTELILNAVVQKASINALNGIKLYSLLYKLAQVMNEHVFNGTKASLFSHSTDLISVHRFPAAAAPAAVVNRPDKISFSVEKMSTPLSIDVTCFDIPNHQVYIQLLSLRPVSGLCHVGRPLSGAEFHPNADFSLRLAFPLKRNASVEQVECSSLRVVEDEKLEYSRSACETVAVGATVRCICKKYGFFFLTRVTKTSENLKTNVPESFRNNLALLLVFVCIRIFAIAGIVGLALMLMSKYCSSTYKYHQNRFYPAFRNFGCVYLFVNYMFIDCLSACLDHCSQAVFCRENGPALLSWNYMQSLLPLPSALALVLTGKTNRLGQMLWNFTTVCAILCAVASIAFQHHNHIFLNQACLPVDPFHYIVILKVVVLAMFVFISIHYLRMPTRRYFDEWLGCFIYILSDTLVIVFGVIMMVGHSGDADKAQTAFIYRFVVNVTVMTLLSTMYQVFFKMSLVKFYRRIYLLTIGRSQLKAIVAKESQYRIFRWINTYSEHDAAKATPSTPSPSRLTLMTTTSSASGLSDSTGSSYNSSK